MTASNQPQYDYLIVGAGLFGATFAHLATSNGHKCLVIDRRDHVGGNLYCREVENINVHVYGAHIFHTSNSRVWNFVNSLVPFNRYTNCPVACHGGKLYNLPFNMNTFYALWGVTTPEQAREKIDSQRAAALEALAGREPQNLEEQALSLVGRDIYETLIKVYTEKQWGRPCTELPAFIIKRLPLRFTFDNNYFSDLYQGIPIGGYNPLITKLLEGSDVRTGVDFFADRAHLESLAKKVIYTGPLDEYFSYSLGRLQWRSVKFDTRTLPIANFQGNAVINYTEASVPYTRIIEHKHFETFGDAVYKNPHTVVSYEHSSEWQPGREPYYPINDARNNALADEYRRMASQLQDVYFGGRLADYRYYDMAPVIERAFELFERIEK